MLKYIRLSSWAGYDFKLFMGHTKHNIEADIHIAASTEPAIVLSAGFVGKDEDGQFYCYGESVSLDLPSLPEDTEILNMLMSRGF